MSISPARRRTRLAVTALAAAVLLAPLIAQAATRPTFRGFHISGTKLLDANGKQFVIRGVNHTFAAHVDQLPALDEMKKAGANTVQVEISGGRNANVTVSDVKAIIARCKQDKLICVLEDTDTGGYGESGQTGAVTMATAAGYWLSLKPALTGQEPYVILNIGAMPEGSTLASSWTADAVAAVKKLRAGGLRHALLVSGPDYGEDSSGVMRTHSPEVLAADPQHNTGFAVSMYAQYQSAAAITSYVSAYQVKNLLLVIGQFSWTYLPWGDVDEADIMAYAQQKNVGWLAYAWSGSSTERAYADMVLNWNPALQTPWGGTVITGANGWQATSKQASVYG